MNLSKIPHLHYQNKNYRLLKTMLLGEHCLNQPVITNGWNRNNVAPTNIGGTILLSMLKHKHCFIGGTILLSMLPS